MKSYTAFQRAVWKACAEIPPGETRSYAWIARRIGKPGAARAVGQALGKNPFAPTIPCHRVVRSDGTLGGYSGRGGLRTKRALLAREARKHLFLLGILSSLTLGVRAETAKLLETPEDLGPATIDVSSYPPEFQKTYYDLFVPLFGFLRGGAARALNSPLLEVSAQQEAALRREAPGLFEDSGVLRAGPDVWRKEVARIRDRPRCCGACPTLTTEDARALWRFLVYDSLQRKTGPAARSWIAHRRSLLRRFAALNKGDENP